MRISYLADHPEFIGALVSWSIEQWRFVLPEDTTAIRTAKFQAHLNRNVLPIAWVAHSEDEVFGMAALRAYDLEGHEDLTPWLGGVLVGPPFRRRGIGTALCHFVEEEACALGLRTLYLFTLDRHEWYLPAGASLSHAAGTAIQAISCRSSYMPPNCAATDRRLGSPTHSWSAAAELER